MTVINIPQSPSRRIAAEVRAEAARQGISLREVARRLDVSQMWLSRRVKVTADVDLTFEELERIAAVLDVPVERLLGGWLSDKPHGAAVTNRYRPHAAHEYGVAA